MNTKDIVTSIALATVPGAVAVLQNRAWRSMTQKNSLRSQQDDSLNRFDRCWENANEVCLNVTFGVAYPIVIDATTTCVGAYGISYFDNNAIGAAAMLGCSLAYRIGANLLSRYHLDNA